MKDGANIEDQAAGSLSQSKVLALSAATAVIIASPYYIHPIIALIAADFGVGAAMIGAAPALNQLALALGVLLLLPLGDRLNNRRLIPVFLLAQAITLVAMALATDFWVFIAASTLLGFFTITPYLLPAYASKRVETHRLGHVTAMLATGVTAGILLSRAGAGVLGEFAGWRQVYWLAAALMLAAAIALPWIMEDDPPPPPAPPSQSYGALLLSLFDLAVRHPAVLSSGLIQGLNFATFLAIWLGLGLYLTSPEMGYGADIPGYLALLGVVNLLATPWLGAWADRVGALQARRLAALAQLAGALLLFFAGGDLLLIALAIVATNITIPVIDVTGRMVALAEAPEIRTRLMTLYIVIMFVGGGIGSWAAAAAYEVGGWTGSAGLTVAIAGLVAALSWVTSRRADRSR